MKVRGFEKVSSQKDNPDVILPRRATPKSMAYDFFSPVDAALPAKGELLVKTGIKPYMQDDEGLFIYPRSSWAIKHGISLKNSVGLLDADYYDNESNEGEMVVALMNTSGKDLVIKKGDRFCQAVFKKILLADGDEPINPKRKGGMGSTG